VDVLSETTELKVGESGVIVWLMNQTTYIRVLLVVDTVTSEIVVRTSIFLVRFNGTLTEALGYVGDPALGCPSTKLVPYALK
jgi:hypothetical protein